MHNKIKFMMKKSKKDVSKKNSTISVLENKKSKEYG